MKKQTMLLSYSLLFLCLLHVYSCTKLPPHFDPADAGNVYNGCRVKKITNYHQIRVFEYNNNNDPVSISNSLLGTGNPAMAFKYDNKKRLIQYAANYAEGVGFEILHKYGYSQNRISTDTVYLLGGYDLNGQPVHYFDKRLAYLQYDDLNRVAQDSMISLRSPGPFAVITKYNYDQAGNLLYTNGEVISNIQYDNKLNPHRTNKIWMFIDLNYSVNNPGKATTYNSADLPLPYNPGAGVYGLRFAGLNVSDSSQLEYDCK